MLVFQETRASKLPDSPRFVYRRWLQPFPLPYNATTKGSDRNINCTPPPPVGPEYEFIVSHYNENLEWLESYADHSQPKYT